MFQGGGRGESTLCVTAHLCRIAATSLPEPQNSAQGLNLEAKRLSEQDPVSSVRKWNQTENNLIRCINTQDSYLAVPLGS